MVSHGHFACVSNGPFRQEEEGSRKLNKQKEVYYILDKGRKKQKEEAKGNKKICIPWRSACKGKGKKETKKEEVEMNRQTVG